MLSFQFSALEKYSAPENKSGTIERTAAQQAATQVLASAAMFGAAG
jgi:hypothetical protein